MPVKTKADKPKPPATKKAAPKKVARKKATQKPTLPKQEPVFKTEAQTKRGGRRIETQLERMQIIALLRDTGYNYTEVTKRTGVPKATILKWQEDVGIVASMSAEVNNEEYERIAKRNNVIAKYIERNHKDPLSARELKTAKPLQEALTSFAQEAQDLRKLRMNEFLEEVGSLKVAIIHRVSALLERTTPYHIKDLTDALRFLHEITRQGTEYADKPSINQFFLTQLNAAQQDMTTEDADEGSTHIIDID